MNTAFQTVSIFALLAVLSPSAEAEDPMRLDDYTCRQLLADREEVALAAKEKLHMMEYWATGYAAAHQKDVPGADPAAVEVVATVLSEACRENPSITAVQAIISAVNKFITAERKASTDSTFTTYPNFDLYGGDSRKVESIEIKECVATCQEDAACRAYSYDRWTKACYLKSSVAVLNLDPTSTSGIRSGLPPAPRSTSPVRISRLVSKAFNGTSRSIRAASREACEQDCQQDRSCLGYTFSRNNKTCNVFDSIDTYQPNTSAISGLKTQNPP